MLFGRNDVVDFRETVSTSENQDFLKVTVWDERETNHGSIQERPWLNSQEKVTL